MFAVADWMKMKNSEEKRKAEYEKSVNPPSLKETLAHLEENRQIQKEISEWEKKIIVIGKDIPANGTPEDYIKYPYIAEVVEMLCSWKEKNYGKLSMHLKKYFRQIYQIKKEQENAANYLKKRY